MSTHVNNLPESVFLIDDFYPITNGSDEAKLWNEIIPMEKHQCQKQH
jgi:hypothetical protein